MEPVTIVLAGLGGYGMAYVNALLDAEDKNGFRLVGIVDPFPDACARLEELTELGTPLFPSLEEFYRARNAALVIISSPIQYHASQICLALAHGSHVLCEKPLCATAVDGRRIVRASASAGRFVAIGYQWSFSDAVLNLKRDIISGRFGRPLRMKTLVLWPRDRRYYQRSWAGRKYTDDGPAVFDSIANNAAAHYLHNMLFLLGDGIDGSAVPTSAVAELYRANDIENYDTIALKAETERCGELYFFASHAVDIAVNPTFHYEFEHAGITYSDEATHGRILATFKDGHMVYYGSPNAEPMRKLWHAIGAAGCGAALPCTAATALPHVLLVDAVQRSVEDIPRFPEHMIHMNNGVVYAEGLVEVLAGCYQDCLMPSDKHFSWAYRGKEIQIGR